MQPELTSLEYLDNLSVLQDGRYNLAVHSADMQLRSIFAHDRIDNPAVNITEIQNDSFPRYCQSFSANDLLSLSAVGLDPEVVVSEATATKYDNSVRILKTVEIDKDKLDVYAAEGGLKLLLNIDGVESRYGNSATHTGVNEKVKQRFAQSPAHQASHKAIAILAHSEETPHGITTDPFDPLIDPLGTLAFLEDLGLMRGLDSRFRQGQSAQDILETAVANIPDFIATKKETDGSHSIVWGDGWASGVIKKLHIDKTTGSYQFSAVQDPAANYFEQANQSAEKAIPFIETECARELCSILDKKGLMFHPSIQAEIMGMGEADRYGSIYTQISREIAKWVDNPDRTQLSNLFVPHEADYYGTEVAKKMVYGKSMPIYQYENRHGYEDFDEPDTRKETPEVLVREKWISAPHSADGEAANVLLTMIDDSLARDPSSEQITDLPVTKGPVKIRDGACFDVTSYYVGAATNAHSQPLRKVTESGVTLLEKTMGAHTFLSTEPMVFNGVRLPKGALFIKSKDGWAFTRLTMFAFDQPQDQIAVGGSELAKTLKNEQEAVRQLGSSTLDALIDSAR